MKKSMQWDIVGIFALILGLTGIIGLSMGDFNLIPGKLTLDTFLFALTNPFLIVICIAFSFLCFALGFFEGKKEEQKNPA